MAVYMFSHKLTQTEYEDQIINYVGARINFSIEGGGGSVNMMGSVGGVGKGIG